MCDGGITLGIVDDHVLLRRTIRDFLVNAGFTVSFDVGSVTEMINELEKLIHQPDILLVDIKLRGHNGIAALEYVEKKSPYIRSIAFSMLTCIDAIADMLEAGAAGFISKTADPLDLVNGIKSVYMGNKVVIDPDLKRDYPSFLAHLNQRNKLSDREKNFLKLCSSELTYKEIADTLYMSPKTADKYRETLFTKLSVKSRIGLVRYAIHNGLVE